MEADLFNLGVRQSARDVSDRRAYLCHRGGRLELVAVRPACGICGTRLDGKLPHPAGEPRGSGLRRGVPENCLTSALVGPNRVIC